MSRLQELKALAAHEEEIKASIVREVAELSAQAHAAANDASAAACLRAIQSRLAELKTLAAEQASRAERLLKRMAELPQESMPPAAAKPSPPAGSAEPAVPAARQKTVMVVDDSPDVVGLLTYMLKKEGRHTVVAALSGDQALRMLGVEPPSEQAELPDLIILDIMMPGVDGYSVNLKLLDDPRTRQIPVIILTAKGQVQDLFRMSSNVKAVVEKPFDPSKLRQLIEESLPPAV